MLWVRTRSWFTGPLHQPRQISLAPYGHKPLMSLQRYVTIRYTTPLTVPLFWLTAVWWQSHLPYIIHGDSGPAHSAPTRGLDDILHAKRSSDDEDWFCYAHTKSSPVSKTYLDITVKDFFNGYNKVSERRLFFFYLWWSLLLNTNHSEIIHFGIYCYPLQYQSIQAREVSWGVANFSAVSEVNNQSQGHSFSFTSI